MMMKLAVITAAIAAFFVSVPVDAGHPLERLEAITTPMKPGEWTLLSGSVPPWGTVGDKASAAYDFRRHNWYFAAAGGNPLFYNFEGLQWGRRSTTSPVIGAQYDGVVWHDGRNSGLWMNGTTASEYSEVTGWRTPLPLTPAISSSAPISFYRPKSNSAVVIPIAASQGPFEITTAGAVARRSSTAWKTSGSGVGAYDWIRDQAYIFHSDGSGTTFYVLGSSALASNPLGAPAVAAVQPSELTGAGGIGHTCGLLFVDDYDMLFAWCGGRALWTYEPRNSRWTKYDNAWSDAAPTSGGAVAVNNRLIYISELRVFAGFTNPTEGVWLYKFLSEPEPEGAVINGCGNINGPCVALNNPTSLTAWQTASVPASGGTIVVMADHQVDGIRSVINQGWLKIVGKGRMANAACLAVPPRGDCDRPDMYQTEVQHAVAGWMNANASSPTAGAGAITVQHLHINHFAGTCIFGGTGQYSRHRQMIQVVDSELDHCADKMLAWSADNRGDFPDSPPNDKVILDRTQLHHAGGEHNIYATVTGFTQFKRSASWAPSGGGTGSGATHSVKYEGRFFDIEDSIISSGDIDGDTDCSDLQDWTLAAGTRGTCRGNSPPVDGASCSAGVFRGNNIRTSFRGGSNSNMSKLCGTWVNTTGNIWRVYDVVWGKANQGQSLGAGQRKMAKNWLAAQGDWYYSPTEYAVYMYSVGNPTTVYGVCASTTLTMIPPINALGVYTWTLQNRGSMSGCDEGSYKPMDGLPVALASGPAIAGYSIADKSFLWGGGVGAPDTGNYYWDDVASGGLGSTEVEARNPWLLSKFISGNTFRCKNCAAWHNGGGTTLAPTGYVMVDQGSEPGEKYQSGDQSGPLWCKRWFCNLFPGDADCTNATDFAGVTTCDALPAGFIERGRSYHVGNCVDGYQAGMSWDPRLTNTFVFGSYGPPNWGFGGLSIFDAPRVFSAGNDTCPAGHDVAPSWFVTSFLDPAMFWRKYRWGTRGGEYGYTGGSSAH